MPKHRKSTFAKKKTQARAPLLSQQSKIHVADQEQSSVHRTAGKQAHPASESSSLSGRHGSQSYLSPMNLFPQQVPWSLSEKTRSDFRKAALKIEGRVGAFLAMLNEPTKRTKMTKLRKHNLLSAQKTAGVNNHPPAAEAASKAANASPKTARRKSPFTSSFPGRCLSWVARLLIQGLSTSFQLVGWSILVVVAVAIATIGVFGMELGRVLRVARGKSNPSKVGWLPFLLLLPIKLLSIPLRVLAYAATPVTVLLVTLRTLGVRSLLKIYGVLDAPTWRQKVYCSLRMMFYLTIVSPGLTLLSLPHYAFSTICAVWNSQTYIDIWLHHKLGGSQLCARPTCDQPLGMIIIQQHCSFLPGYEKWFYPFSTTQALASNSSQDLDAMVADDDKVNFLSATILSMIVNRQGLSPQSQTFYLYSLLGCNKSDDPAVINRKMRGVMKGQHPDKCQGNRTTAYDALNSSKQVLCDPFYRCVYDALGDESLERFAITSDMCAHIRALAGIHSSGSSAPAVRAVPATTFATTPLLLNSSSHTAPTSTLVSQAAPATPR